VLNDYIIVRVFWCCAFLNYTDCMLFHTDAFTIHDVFGPKFAMHSCVKLKSM